VVQARVKAVDDFPNDGTPISGWLADISHPKQWPPLFVELGDKSVRVWLSEEFRYSLAKSVQVLLCPAELEINSL
jgi:hypothetical protein